MLNFLRYTLRKIKWVFLAAISGELPHKNILEIVELFNEKFVDETQNFQKIVFLSWRSIWFSKSHFYSIKNFIERNPEFKFVFFDRNLQNKWMKDNFASKEIYYVYTNTIFGASKSDIFRYCLINKYGGIYFSINYTYLGILSDLICDDRKFILPEAGQEYKSNFTHFSRDKASHDLAYFNAYLISARNNPILIEVVEMIVSRFFLARGQRYNIVDRAVWWFTGPYVFTDAILKCLSKGKPEDIICLKKIDYLLFKRIKVAEFRYAISPSYIGYKNSKLVR